jgi:hypothetical protein
VAASLAVDEETLLTVAASFDNEAGRVPSQVFLDLEGCGSASVASAAENFNMWGKVAAQVAAGRLRAVATEARSTAATFAAKDTELAAGAAGGN